MGLVDEDHIEAQPGVLVQEPVEPLLGQDKCPVLSLNRIHLGVGHHLAQPLNVRVDQPLFRLGQQSLRGHEDQDPLPWIFPHRLDDELRFTVTGRSNHD
ncbi:hypothetical protein D3C85_1068440 [compost metagenome]